MSILAGFTAPRFAALGSPELNTAEYLGRLGYFQDTAGQLDADLREQILSLDAQPGRPSPYGQKYETLGPLMGPNGKSGWVRTHRIVLPGETAPRLVTLIPAEMP